MDSKFLCFLQEPGESRRPTLTWPREIPIRTDGPQDVIDFTDAYRTWLSSDPNLPKLYIHAEPGFFATGIMRQLKRERWPNVKIIKAAGGHFLQEDSPDTIGKAIAEFLTKDVFPKSK